MYGKKAVVCAVALLAALEIKSYLFTSDTVSGHLAQMRDGDTIGVAGRPIRLQGLHCGGLENRFEAQDAVFRLLAEHPLTCYLTGETVEGREVGSCYLPDGTDVAALLIERRICGRCANHDVARRYAAAQAKAGPYAGELPHHCAGAW